LVKGWGEDFGFFGFLKKIETNFLYADKYNTSFDYHMAIMEQDEIRFYDYLENEMEDIQNTYEMHKLDANPRLANDYAKKYPFLKSKSRLPSIDEILTWRNVKDHFDHTTKIEPILKKFISKITGIYKHGQTEKTGLCNLRIMTNIELGKLTIAISKNTLSSKEQWESRLINDLKKKYPRVALDNIILVISSKKNTLDGNATHCKNVDDAISKYTRGAYKIIFICSNNQRINDIRTFLKSYRNLSPEKRLLIDVQHDEAHNIKEGIPSKRNAIEHIIMNPFVESYVPVTASYDPILDEKKALWKKANIDMYAIDYTKNSKTVSTSENYSSISDAYPINFDQIKAHPSYKNHNITEFDEQTFIDADDPSRYSGPGWKDKPSHIIKADRDRRRQLEYHFFMNMELEAYNLGLNILDNFFTYTYKKGDITIETPMILPGVKNTHIITTPLRVAFTMSLIKYAMTKEYNPICLGIYRGGLHIWYKNQRGQLITKLFADLNMEGRSGEMNNKIYEALQYITIMGETIECPILIIGNYTPTGESITFVNYLYGTIRSDTLLPVSGQTREMNYQGFLRSCYMDTKFKENAPNRVFEHPPKWIIGSQSSINDAINYERENDERIQRLENSEDMPPLLQPVVPKMAVDEETNTSTPALSVIEDMEDSLAKKLWEIFEKPTRNEAEKATVLKTLKMMKEKKTLLFIDPTGNFDFDRFTLKSLRCYKKYTPEEIETRKASHGDKYKPVEADWRFPQYDSAHTLNRPYMNDKSNIGVNECEMLVAFEKYEHEGFVNHRARIWLSYRFE